MASECRPLWPLPGVLIVNGRKNSMGRRREVGFFWVVEGMLLCSELSQIFFFCRCAYLASR